MAKELVAELTVLKSRAGERKAGTAETARTREVLHTALDLYYDQFSAADKPNVFLQNNGSFFLPVPRANSMGRAVASFPLQGDPQQQQSNSNAGGTAMRSHAIGSVLVSLLLV